ncbi:hypothetical protein CORC01_13921 [Colletotrichum orchidophilum]|uniref:Uncharacterized protein n=1 Tax=Colletotrichum orchidophilum TaxID=1209926 RepID=A0A1G4ANU0_9PEZI|nr:uncharacterized protein CORC01_13921 [Colletotrichum orchidophilum]OHE90781.1 hypothetical protein CORC01_13921 [Colletotrichum orchidophilum]
MSHPTPPYSETDQMDQQGSRQPAQQQPQRETHPPKTETEEKIEKETPRLNPDASLSASDTNTRYEDTKKHVAKRSKRHDEPKTSGGGRQQRQKREQQQQVVPQNQQNQQVQNKSSSGAPSVKLDMDLDVDIDLKAKIQGDITLSIL